MPIAAGIFTNAVSHAPIGRTGAAGNFAGFAMVFSPKSQNGGTSNKKHWPCAAAKPHCAPVRGM
jgi:hypothetical protein